MMKKLCLGVGVLVLILGAVGAQQKPKSADVMMGTAMHQEEVEGNLEAAIATYKSVIAASGADRALAARAQVRIGQCHEKLGNAEARKAYETVLSQYADQAEPARLARERLGALQAGMAAPKSTEPVVRRLWVLDRYWTPQAVSPDGRSLLYTDWTTGDLWLHDLYSGVNRRVTNSGPKADGRTYAELAHFSADGARIAYSWFNEAGKYGIRTIRTDGSDDRLVFASTDQIWQILPHQWSPDGRFILATIDRTDTGYSLVLIGAADGSIRTVKIWGKEEYHEGVFSPDGRWIAYGKKGGVFLIEVASGSETLLEEHSAKNSVLGWMPDGKSLIFLSDRGGSPDGWLLPVDSGKARGAAQLIKKEFPAWLAGIGKGGSIYYIETKHVRNVQIAEIDPSAGRVTIPAQNASSRWTDITRDPSWSPDGRFLAFIREAKKPDERGLIIRSAQSDEERELKTEAKRIARLLRWSLDSKSLFVEGTDGQGRFGILRIDVQSGDSALISNVPDGVGMNQADVSPDGRTCFFNTLDPANLNRGLLRARDLEANRETVLLQAKGTFSLSVSPDGRQLLVGTGNNIEGGQSVVVLPVGGGEGRELVRIGPQEANWRVAPKWTPDGRYAIFAKGKPGHATRDVSLWRVPAEGGAPQPLGLIVDEIWSVSPHPDGRRLAFGSWWLIPELWVFENVLPKR